LLGLAAVHLHAEMPSLDTFFDIPLLKRLLEIVT